MTLRDVLARIERISTVSQRADCHMCGGRVLFYAASAAELGQLQLDIEIELRREQEAAK